MKWYRQLPESLVKLIYKIKGDGVHLNRIMLMTPTGNTIGIPVGFFAFNHGLKNIMFI